MSELEIVELVWKAAVKKNIVSGLKDFVNGKGANIKYGYENRRMEEAKLFNTK